MDSRPTTGKSKMKVIVAGYMKTGTKTMNAALTELGYEVYDFLEHFLYHENEWKKILGPGGLEQSDLTDELRRMYRNVDAVVDGPTFYMWEELAKAFPDAKIILTTREEGAWYQSLCRQLDEVNDSMPYHLFMTFTPTGRKFLRHRQRVLPFEFSCSIAEWEPIKPNKILMEKKYRGHNLHVKQNVAEENLLEFQVTEGWEPLCKFLGKEIPDKPFPHKNVGGQAVKNFMSTTLMRRMKMELFISFGIVCGVGIFAGFKLYKRIA